MNRRGWRTRADLQIFCSNAASFFAVLASGAVRASAAVFASGAVRASTDAITRSCIC